MREFREKIKYIWFFVCLTICFFMAYLCLLINPYDNSSFASALYSFLRPVGAGFGTAIILLSITLLLKNNKI